jgi:hypothetical protein
VKAGQAEEHTMGQFFFRSQSQSRLCPANELVIPLLSHVMAAGRRDDVCVTAAAASCQGRSALTVRM